MDARFGPLRTMRLATRRVPHFDGCTFRPFTDNATRNTASATFRWMHVSALYGQCDSQHGECHISMDARFGPLRTMRLATRRVPHFDGCTFRPSTDNAPRNTASATFRWIHVSALYGQCASQHGECHISMDPR